jgi:aspartate ammonia-lyase
VADAARARELLDRSTALATALSPHIGYAETAAIAKLSVETGRPIREIVRERRLVPDRALDAILSAEAMTSPGRPGEKSYKQQPRKNQKAGRKEGRRRR